MRLKSFLNSSIILTQITSAGKLDFVTDSSAECRVKCLNEQAKFCVKADYSSGRCCSWNESYCGGEMFDGFCSDDLVE